MLKIDYVESYTQLCAFQRDPMIQIISWRETEDGLIEIVYREFDDA